MRLKTIFLLAAVTVPVAAIAILLPAPGADVATVPTGASGPLLPQLKAHEDALAQIAVTGGNGTVTLTRTPVAGKPAQGWTLREKGGYKVPAATMQTLIDALANLHGVAPKTELASLYSRLDLGEPGHGQAANLLVLSDAKGAALGSVVLGKHRYANGPGSGERIYVRVPGAPRTWLAAPFVFVPADTLDWIDRTVVDIEADKVRDVVLSQLGSPTVEFSRDKPADKLDVRGVPAGRKLKSDAPGADVADAFGGLNLEDVKPASQVGGSAAGSVHMVTFSGLTLDLALRKDNGHTWATVTADGPDAKPIQARTAGWAYELPSDRAATLMTTMADLLEDTKK